MKDKDFKAIALKYDIDKDKAPKVVAKGLRELGERIVKLAKESGVPIKEDKDLAEVLIKLELYEEIPSELYYAIAEVLAYVYKINLKAEKER